MFKVTARKGSEPGLYSSRTGAHKHFAKTATLLWVLIYLCIASLPLTRQDIRKCLHKIKI